MILSALLGKVGMSGQLLIVLAFALMLYIAIPNIAHSLVPHVINAHAYQLACGSYPGPPCGSIAFPIK